MPKHRCAADLAPRNLLFPRWLPGTAQNCTPAANARQISLAWLLGAKFLRREGCRRWRFAAPRA